MFPIDELFRTRRRSIALIVQPDGRLVVRAPLRASQEDIRRAVEKHAAWIQKRQAQARETPWTPRKYLPGEVFHFLGEPHQLMLVEKGRPALLLEGETFSLARRYQSKAAAVFRAWYRQQAACLLPERVAALAGRHGFRPRGVRITSARTRWGSCSPGGMLAFTWRLMIAPWPVIDYVILHELAHLEIKNHAEAFWERVRELAPDYKEHIHWLKKHGKLAMDL